jgi:hypothetical protein
VRSVGVRSGFYRETLPDGTSSDRLDPAMSALENSALQVMRTVDERWPLLGEDRAKVAEFIALQMMRTPAWREWYAQALENSLAELRARGDRSERSLLDAWEYMASDTERHERIVGNLAATGTLFANMHWTLLRAGAPRLATSDHPVVPIAFGPAALQPVSPVPAYGTFATSEFRFALSPRHLLLMTWLDDYGPEPSDRIKIHEVREHNAVVISQAEQQWFHVPGTAIERAQPPYRPIALQRYASRNYHPHSRRREQVMFSVEEMNEQADPDVMTTGLRVIEWGVPRPRI